MCQAMVPFLIILFIVTLVVSITQMPLLMVTLRSVREEERAFALGMQFVIFRLFGYIPSPIVFGNVIDSTCLLWKQNCAKQGGFCLIYNIEHFRLRYVGVCSALKVAAGLLFFLDWVLVCWTAKRNKDRPIGLNAVKDLVASVISLDRLSVLGLDGAHRDGLEEVQLLDGSLGPDSDYNSANGEEDEEEDAATDHLRQRFRDSAAGAGYPC